MMRLIIASFIGALVIAPVGWSTASPAFLAEVARLMFAALVLASGAMIVLGAVWSRRWAV